jgi:hypothetical protein
MRITWFILKPSDNRPRCKRFVGGYWAKREEHFYCGRLNLLGIDLASEPGDNAIGEIRQVWLEYNVIFFRDQDLPPAKLLAFAKRFGKVVEYPFIKASKAFRGSSRSSSPSPRRRISAGSSAIGKWAVVSVAYGSLVMPASMGCDTCDGISPYRRPRARGMPLPSSYSCQ